jgi:hypothetical protein
MSDDTVTMLRNNPELRHALAENSLAAEALKHCSALCYPLGMKVQQIQQLQQHLMSIESTGSYNKSLINEFLYKNRDDLGGAINELTKYKTSKELDSFLYSNLYPGRLPYMGQRAELLHEAEEFSARHVDELLQRLLTVQGTHRDTFFKDVILPNIKKRMPADSTFGTRDYQALKKVVEKNTLPWQDGFGPDLILVNKGPNRVAVLDLTRAARKAHAAEKAAQATELQALLGKKWTVEYRGDFFHASGITTDKIVKQIEDVLVEFGMRSE